MCFFVFLLVTTQLSPLMFAQQSTAVPSNAAVATTTVAATAVATPTPSLKVVPGSRVYVEKMNGFENYLTAAFAKKKVQLVPVADRQQADYIITGVSEDKKAGWAKIVFMGDLHSDADASVTMTDTRTSAIVFSYAVNKKSTMHGSQTTAEACAKHLQAHIEGRE